MKRLQVFGNSAVQTCRNGRENKREDCERQVCHRMSLARIIRGRNVSMEVERGLRNSILLPTLTYGSETWTWNGTQQSRVYAVDMSYLRGACGVTRWEGESNESLYERCEEVWSYILRGIRVKSL